MKNRSTFLVLSFILFLILGIVFNPYMIANIFSYDDQITRFDLITIILLIEIGFLILSFLSFKFSKNKNTTFEKRLKNIFLFSASLVVAIAIAEIGTRKLRPTPNGFPTSTLLFQPNKNLGWSFIPNIETEVNWPLEAQVNIQINKHGFRDSNEELNQKHWFVGDSFVAALEVEKEQRFTELLEQKSKVEIINLGVNGYGPVQYYLLLDSLLQIYTPTSISIMIYIRNDFYDSSGLVDWMHNFKRPIIKNDSIVFPTNILPTDVVENRKRYFRKRPIRPEDSHFLNLLKLSLKPKDDKRLQAPELELLKKNPTTDILSSYSATYEAITRIQSLCSIKNIPLQIILAPSVVQVQQDYWTILVKEYQLDTTQYNLIEPQKRLTSFLESNGISYIDLTSGLSNSYIENNEPLYFRMNEHWNTEGHHVVASIISNNWGFK